MLDLWESLLFFELKLSLKEVTILVDGVDQNLNRLVVFITRLFL